VRQFVDLPTLATIAGVSRQALEKALLSISKGKLAAWRGASLVVRQVRGRGGRSGFHYEVLESSLPLGLQEQLKACRAAFETPSKPCDDTAAERDWWSLILSAAAEHPKHSRERAAAIAELLSRPLTDWNGHAFAPSPRTIHRKLDTYERGGAHALAGRVRRDKGIARVVISNSWDSVVPFDAATRERIAVALRTYVRGLFKDGASTRIITTLAGNKLRELTAAHGCDYTSAMSERAFDVPRPLIEAERAFRNVAIFNKDRKLYEDTRPRVRRTREGLAPMQVIVGDVHHLDIVMCRPDGSEAWPKAIAWLDMATNRVWLDIGLLGKGEGVRNADVIASFVRMVTAWGMPTTLYLDNGSEYRWSEFIDDAMQLVARIDGNGDDRQSRIVRAKPYNAPAKVIEGIFKVLEYTYFRSIPGWAGGDRTNKKTAKVGHATEPFPGSIDELRLLIGHFLAAYETTAQRGALNNRSPRKVYECALADGWQRVELDLRRIRTVFATSEQRRVHQGAIQYGGQHWTCHELETYFGERVTIRVPKFETPTVLPLLDDAGTVFGFAVPATRYGVLDKAGARESDRMARARRGAIRQLDAMAPTIAAHAEISRLAAALLPSPPAPIVATLTGSDQDQAIAAGMAPGAAHDREARRRAENRKHHIERLAILDRSAREGGGG
jgi:hypothetical protein